MNKWVEVTSKTVEDAVDEGLKTLGIKKGNARVEVLIEPATGFFKFIGNKNAKVRISIEQEPKEYIKCFLLQIMHKVGLSGDIKILDEDEQNINFEIEGNNMGILIGKRGVTLNAIQYLANIVCYRQFNFYKKRVLIDIENYRQKRKKTLELLAHNLASKVSRTQKEIELEPMNPQERRIIHLTLKNNKKITTYSKGEEPYRKVVISNR